MVQSCSSLSACCLGSENTSIKKKGEVCLQAIVQVHNKRRATLSPAAESVQCYFKLVNDGERGSRRSPFSILQTLTQACGEQNIADTAERFDIATMQTANAYLGFFDARVLVERQSSPWSPCTLPRGIPWETIQRMIRNASMELRS